MRIASLSYKDLESGWSIENVTFNNLTLLVGASGVGKTQILECITRLKSICKGNTYSGIYWKLEFEINSGKKCVWEGEYESKGYNFFIQSDDRDRAPAKILFENLIINEKPVIVRDEEKIQFHDYKIPKLPIHLSAIHLLANEDEIGPIYRALQNIIFTEHSKSNKRDEFFNPDLIDADRLKAEYKTIDKIRQSDLELDVKLYLAFQNTKSIAKKIKERFIEVFPFVEDLRFSTLELKERNISTFLKQMPIIQLKEVNVEQWIPNFKFSSGMLRTLFHISAIYLCSEGTILLIDEFENSLGVNCIDEMTAEIHQGGLRDLQFIITSHHPYIINHIDPRNWKLVTRKGSSVHAYDATRYVDFEKSKQKAFIQLTQLEEFTTGIAE